MRMPLPGLACATAANPSSDNPTRARPSVVCPVTVASRSWAGPLAPTAPAPPPLRRTPPGKAVSFASVEVARVHRSNHRGRVQRRRRRRALGDVLSGQPLRLLHLDAGLSVHEIGEL